MTLDEWCKLTGVLPTHPTTERGAVSVVYSRINAHYYVLWRLDDYRVDSVQAGVVWLLPKVVRERVNIKPGEEGEAVMPHSEVCMHMRVAGKLLRFRVTEGQYPAVQLFKDGRPFSSPILTGEAGLYQDDMGLYYYREV